MTLRMFYQPWGFLTEVIFSESLKSPPPPPSATQINNNNNKRLNNFFINVTLRVHESKVQLSNPYHDLYPRYNLVIQANSDHCLRQVLYFFSFIC